MPADMPPGSNDHTTPHRYFRHAELYRRASLRFLARVRQSPQASTEDKALWLEMASRAMAKSSSLIDLAWSVYGLASKA